MAARTTGLSQQHSTLQIGVVADGAGLYTSQRIDGTYSSTERPFDACTADEARIRAHTSRYYRETQEQWRTPRQCRFCKNWYRIDESLGRWQCRRHALANRRCCAETPRPAHIVPMVWQRGCIECDHDDGSTAAPSDLCVAVVVPTPLLLSLKHTVRVSAMQTLRELGSPPGDPNVGSVVWDNVTAMRYPDAQHIVFTADSSL